jgi:nucleoside-diphosphate-sugar epimerase
VTVLVAGATGVLGRALIPLLIADQHRVLAIARNASTADLPAEVEAIDANLLEDDLLELVRGCDAVIHIATAIPSDPSAFGAWDTTARLRTEGTRRLLKATLANRVQRDVQQSIVMAYRDGGDAWLDETAALDDSPEREGICGPVIEMEEMIRAVRPQVLAWTILRGGSFVGAGVGENTLIGKLRTGHVIVAGDGSNYVSLVNVADMASAVAASLELAPAGSTFNIVDEPLHYGDYVDALSDLIGVTRPGRAAELPLPPSWRCTNHAALTTLGWMPRERIWPDHRTVS